MHQVLLSHYASAAGPASPSGNNTEVFKGGLQKNPSKRTNKKKTTKKTHKQTQQHAIQHNFQVHQF